jgi:anti-sigma B factor antagonist
MTHLPSGSTLTIATAHLPSNVALVTLYGELDAAGARQLKTRIVRLLLAQRSRLILDLSKVSFCDSNGINLLVFTRAHTQRHGGWLCLVAPQPCMAKVLNIFALDRVLAIYRSLERAIQDQVSAPLRPPATTVPSADPGRLGRLGVPPQGQKAPTPTPHQPWSAPCVPA